MFSTGDVDALNVLGTRARRHVLLDRDDCGVIDLGVTALPRDRLMVGTGAAGLGSSSSRN